MSYSPVLSAIMLALASNLDNVGVGVAYGIRKTRVPLASNLLIAAITATGTLASMLCGHAVGKLLHQGLASLLAGGLLIGMGLWVMIREALAIYRRDGTRQGFATSTPNLGASYLAKVHTIRVNPLSADGDLSGQIDPAEAVLLGLALTPNNLVNGAAAGVMDLSLALTVILVFLISLATISAGIAAGQQCGRRWLGSLAGVISGALLVLIGTCEIVV